MISFREYLTEGVDNHHKGAFHEHLVNALLNSGKIQDIPRYQALRNKHSDAEFGEQVKRAQSVHKYITQTAHSPIISSVHTGGSTESLQKATGSWSDDSKNNSSDLVLSHVDGTKTGINLKSSEVDRPFNLTKISATTPVSRDVFSGATGGKHVDASRKEILSKHPHLTKLGTNANIDMAIKSDRDVMRSATEISNRHLTSARDHLHIVLSGMDQDKIKKHIKGTIRGGSTIPVKTIKTSGNVPGKYTHSTSGGLDSIEKITSSQEPISVSKAGSNTINYSTGGKVFLSHRIKRNGTTAFGTHSIEPVIPKGR